ncbi:hypothetical protein ENUP19_0287G0030 [Entamoeba nuttalli]|uniref:AMP-dependent synthetase/ligase domain-containing protein n=1 Tax=Entamoeba nuttalli TaxID=412467 RepID=A0ABQ0DU86_9EUKA
MSDNSEHSHSTSQSTKSSMSSSSSTVSSNEKENQQQVETSVSQEPTSVSQEPTSVSQEPTPSPRPVVVEEKPETPVAQPAELTVEEIGGSPSASSSPDIPPVEIAKPSSVSPQEENKSEEQKEVQEPPRAFSKPISPFINGEEEICNFNGKLTEEQQKRLVNNNETLASLYNKAKAYEKKAYTVLGNKIREKTWKEFINDVEGFACGFLKQTHKAVIISMANSENAYSIGFAAMLTGRYVCYVNPTLPTYRFESIVNLINADVAFIDNTIIDNFKEVQKTHENLQLVIVGTDVGKDKNLCSMSVYFNEKVDKTAFEEQLKELKPETVAEIIPLVHGQGYKGVIWTHSNICAALKSNDPGLSSEMTIMEVLPQSAFGERIYGMYFALNAELHVIIAQPTDLQFGGPKFMKMLKQHKPKFMLGTPRIYEKISNYASDKIDKSTILTRKAKNFAAKKGVDGQMKQGVGESKPKGYGISRTLVYNKALKAIGLHKCYCACWGVMSEKSRAKCLGLGITVFEGLMLPETTGFCLMQKKNLYVPGSYGCKVKECNIEIREGEIIANGSVVSCGYCNEGSQHVYPFENGFKTYLMATSSKFGKEKEEFYQPNGYKYPLIVTSNAEMIEPHYIEKMLCTIPTIVKCIILGENEKFLSALFEINYDKAKEELKEKCPSKENIRSDAFFGTFLRQKVEAFNQTLPRSYRIKKFVVVDLPDVECATDSNTSMEKRNATIKKYEKGIDKLYHQPKAVEEADEKKRKKEQEEIQKQRRKEEKEREKQAKKQKKEEKKNAKKD